MDGLPLRTTRAPAARSLLGAPRWRQTQLALAAARNRRIWKPRRSFDNPFPDRNVFVDTTEDRAFKVGILREHVSSAASKIRHQESSITSVINARSSTFLVHGSLFNFWQSFSYMSIWTRSLHGRFPISAGTLFWLHCLLVIQYHFGQLNCCFSAGCKISCIVVQLYARCELFRRRGGKALLHGSAQLPTGTQMRSPTFFIACIRGSLIPPSLAPQRRCETKSAEESSKFLSPGALPASSLPVPTRLKLTRPACSFRSASLPTFRRIDILVCILAEATSLVEMQTLIKTERETCCQTTMILCFT